MLLAADFRCHATVRHDAADADVIAAADIIDMLIAAIAAFMTPLCRHAIAAAARCRRRHAARCHLIRRCYFVAVVCCCLLSILTAYRLAMILPAMSLFYYVRRCFSPDGDITARHS